LTSLYLNVLAKLSEGFGREESVIFSCLELVFMVI
jgi:hypothetical protein